MQLEKVKVKIRCEMGACKQKASYTIRMARVGIKSRIHICEDCLETLATCIEDARVVSVTTSSLTVNDNAKVPPKSVETLKPKKNKE